MNPRASTNWYRWVRLVPTPLAILLTGCSSFAQSKPDANRFSFGQAMRDFKALKKDGQTTAFSTPFSAFDTVKRRSLERMTRLADGSWQVHGEEDEHIRSAKALFAEAEQAYVNKNYEQSANLFSVLASRAGKCQLQEDALFFAGESYFQTEQFPKAVKAYQQLVADFPTSRYIPQCSQRLYDVAYFWLEDSRQRSKGAAPTTPWQSRFINFTDKRRPAVGTEEAALNLIKTIEQAEPTGPLTDDARVMAAAHIFNNASTDFDYVRAAGHYETLAQTQPNSEHMDRALFLGSQARLRAYRGPHYDGADLRIAKQLATQAITRNNLSPEQATALKEEMRLVDDEFARRELEIAMTYERMNRRNAARFCYRRVIEKFPNTDVASQAKSALQRLGPEEPEKKPWLEEVAEDTLKRTETWRSAASRRGKIDPNVQPATKPTTNQMSLAELSKLKPAPESLAPKLGAPTEQVAQKRDDIKPQILQARGQESRGMVKPAIADPKQPLSQDDDVPPPPSLSPIRQDEGNRSARLLPPSP